MKTKLGLAPLILSVLAIMFLAVVFAEISVGVKQGDWVEYTVTFTGNPPAEHDVVWARMEVINVEGKRVNATFVSLLANETTLNVMEDLNLESGRLIDMFIVPANLSVGKAFYDQTVGQIAIDSVEVRTYAGASRTVMHAEAVETQWFWDKTTGVVVEAKTSNSMYTLNTLATRTNLWYPQILGLDLASFYALVIISVVGAIAVIFILAARKRRLGLHNSFLTTKQRLHY